MWTNTYIPPEGVTHGQRIHAKVLIVFQMQCASYGNTRSISLKRLIAVASDGDLKEVKQKS